MALTATRTHTVFYTADNLEPLYHEIRKLRDDFELRRQYMDRTAAERCDARLSILERAAELLGEET